MSKPEIVAELLQNGDELSARDLFVADASPTQLAGGQPKEIRQAGAGTIVRVVREEDGWRAREILASKKSALAKMFLLAAEHALDPIFPVAVDKEVQALLADPGIDDPALEDLTHLPFVTIDGPGTRDLDQAMYIEPRDGGGGVVWYALADPAWCVKPGTALFEESLRRGASFYLPGLCVPMLPRALSEGITSLNEKSLRRAVVFEMSVDESGECIQTEVSRARVRSCAQLTFRQVQRFLDEQTPLPDRAAEPSVKLLRGVGRARMRRAEQRNVIHYRRSEVEVKLSGGLRFVIDLEPRSSVEKYNEQLSLMCNVEGARLLRDGDETDDNVQPIYRVHASPDHRRYEKLEGLLEAIATRHGLDGEQWSWRRKDERSLADFLAALPMEGSAGRIASAIHRQAVLTNVRSVFSDQPSGHHGVGADVYARFSAPMHELVGVFLHKELFEKLSDGGSAATKDDELRERIISRANESKALQKRLTKEANRIVIDEIFEADRQLARDERPARAGTVMGLTPTKAHILLDDPRIEVKVYTRHQADVGGGKVVMSDDGAAILHIEGNTERELCRIGDEVHVAVHDRDNRGDRWMLVIK
jgi:ribonuclease R